MTRKRWVNTMKGNQRDILGLRCSLITRISWWKCTSYRDKTKEQNNKNICECGLLKPSINRSFFYLRSFESVFRETPPSYRADWEVIGYRKPRLALKSGPAIPLPCALPKWPRYHYNKINFPFLVMCVAQWYIGY